MVVNTINFFLTFLGISDHLCSVGLICYAKIESKCFTLSTLFQCLNYTGIAFHAILKFKIYDLQKNDNIWKIKNFNFFNSSLRFSSASRNGTLLFYKSFLIKIHNIRKKKPLKLIIN